jgi:hypothetical protein
MGVSGELVSPWAVDSGVAVTKDVSSDNSHQGLTGRV